MNRYAMWVTLLLLLPPSLFAAEKSLSNADVVRLSKLGLGDEAIIAKIRQVDEVDFRVETDDLVKLKNAGVGSKVIAAMIDRTSVPVSRQTVFAGPEGVAVITSGAAHVKMVSSDGTSALTGLVGEPSSTYAYVTMLFWLNLPGLNASHRSNDRNPSFLVAADRDPRSRYYIVRLDVNSEDGDRSLKMGRSGAFSFRAGTAPDPDWAFAFDAAEEKKGTWRMVLKKPLEPGEYRIFSVQSREVYDFGID